MDLSELLVITCGTTDPLNLLLRGGAVTRYHAEVLPWRQSNAEHVWRTVVILHHLWPDASRDLILATMYHDAAEALIGDIPAPVKRVPAIRSGVQEIENAVEAHLGLDYHDLSFVDGVRLKCADYLELCLTCSAHSSRAARRILANGVEYVTRLTRSLPADESERVKGLLSRIEQEAEA